MLKSPPVRQTMQQVPNAAMGASVSADGKTAQSITRVSNRITGDNELHIRLVVAGADVPSVTIFPGAWDTATTIKAGVTFTADGWASFASFIKYFGVNSTNIAGMRIETSDTSNFSSQLEFTKKDVTGEDKTVKVRLSKYRMPVGNGWSETIEIGEDDLSFLLVPNIAMVLSNAVASSTIDMYFYVRGANDSRDLSPVQNSII